MSKETDVAQTAQLNSDEDTITIEHKRFRTKVTIAYMGVSSIGESVCRKTDKFSAPVGEGIALGRALAQLGEAYAKLWEDRAQTLEEWKKSHPSKSLPALPR